MGVRLLRGLLLTFGLAVSAFAQSDCAAVVSARASYQVTEKSGIPLGGTLELRDHRLWFFPHFAEAILLAEGEPMQWVEGVRVHGREIQLMFVQIAR